MKFLINFSYSWCSRNSHKKCKICARSVKIHNLHVNTEIGSQSQLIFIREFLWVCLQTNESEFISSSSSSPSVLVLLFLFNENTSLVARCLKLSIQSSDRSRQQLCIALFVSPLIGRMENMRANSTEEMPSISKCDHFNAMKLLLLSFLASQLL